MVNNRTPGDYSLPPDRRPQTPHQASSHVEVYGGNKPEWSQVSNSHGVTPRWREAESRWVQYECRCGNLFWMTGPPSQVRGCRQQHMECKARDDRAGTTMLQLTGKEYGGGDLIVTGHERGKGWKVRCICGRERFIINSTMLAAGSYATCGQCNREERDRKRREIVIAASGAPPSDLRSSVVAGNISCSDGHQAITFDPADGGGDGCPLCLALARIEMLEAQQTSSARRSPRWGSAVPA